MKGMINSEFIINTVILLLMVFAAFILNWEIKLITIVSASFYVIIYSILFIPYLLNYVKDKKEIINNGSSSFQDKTIL
ncbi:hypothetical protein JXR93_10105 [bacterium]|nr:hypothetical protein [bacterium]